MAISSVEASYAASGDSLPNLAAQMRSDASYRLHFDHCTVAAEAFETDIAGSNTFAIEGASLGTLLPKLILERLSLEMERDVTDEERMQDKLWPLRQERLELFMQLDNAIKERDSAVLLNLSKAARKRRLRLAQKTIDEASDALKKNLEKTDKTIEEETKTAESARKAAKILENARLANDESKVRGKDIKDIRPPLKINLYKNSSAALWDPKIKEAFDTDDKHTSVKYAAAAVSSGIDILIAGKVRAMEGYLSVTATVYVYPLAKEASTAFGAGTINDAGEPGNLPSFAERLAKLLMPIITNMRPAKLLLKVEPEDAVSKINIFAGMIAIDGSTYTGESAKTLLEEGTTINAGMHTLSFSVDGYHPVSAAYLFEGGKGYNVLTIMQEKQDAQISLRFRGLEKSQDAFAAPRSVAANAMTGEWLDDNQMQSTIKINGLPLLGVVLTQNAAPAQFYVPLSLIENNASLEVKTNIFDRAAYIDKRRRWFYLSYSALITSLIGAFYTAGRYNAMNGYENPDTLKKWRNAKNISASVSAACGGWAIYELVRYLRAASKVLPDEAKKDEESSGTSDNSGGNGYESNESGKRSSEESIQVLQSDDMPPPSSVPER